MATDFKQKFKYPICEKQLSLIRLCREKNGVKKKILASGSRATGKTLGCLYAVCDHAWHTKRGAVGILVPTIKAGSSSGIWTLLTEIVIPSCIEGEYGFEWETTPRQDGGTKQFYCYIKNKHGGKTRIELVSLKDERDVEITFKNRYYSMIYWGELSNFELRSTYDALIESLRGVGLDDDDFVLLCDTNPSSEGTESWIYKLWFEFRIDTEVSLDDVVLQRGLKLMEFFLDDNPYLSEERKATIRGQYKHDPDLYDRYVLGRWVRASRNSIFADVFRKSVHVLGDIKEVNPEIYVPEENCWELVTGWDFGYTNSAAVIAEKIIARTKDNEKVVAHFKFIDELVFIKDQIDIVEFTRMFVDKMRFWEAYLGRRIRWRHWSDTTAFDNKDPYSKQYQYQMIYAASDGLISLEAADRSPGSLPMGIDLWRKLLFQERMTFSAAKCPKLIEMNQAIQMGDKPGTISKGSIYKHPFDAARYLVSREAWEDLQDQIQTMRTVNRKKVELTAIRL